VTLKKHWTVRSEPDNGVFAEFGTIPRPIARALFHRGISDGKSARVFFTPEPAAADPFLMRDMGAAAERIVRAVRSGEPITVYGDYDTDGVTATALLIRALQSLEAKVSPYIPSRFEEGYGLNCSALQSLAGQGAKIIVSVDCGARSVEEAEYARSLGVDLIITDHHAPGETHPPAFAFIDPKRGDCPYPDKNLAGVGVAYRLLQAILQSLPPGGWQAEEFLDLVALGTVADMAPLLGENRSLVQVGLQRINQSGSFAIRPGLAELLRTAGIRRASVNATCIGFVLGPRLNAAGRIDTANSALQLLLTDDIHLAGDLATGLETRNRERQALTRSTFLEARRMTLERLGSASGDPPFFLMAHNAEFNPGVIGLAASKLMEEFYRPSAVVAVEGEFARGSVRSIPGFHITEALDSCRDLLERYGGHAAAAGFTVRLDRLEELHHRLDRMARLAFAGQSVQPEISIDSEVSLPELTWDLLGWIKKMEPFGQGNPAPILAARGLRVSSKRSVGKDGSHLKLALTDGQTRFDAIAFHQGPREASLPPVVDVAFSLEENEYYGKQLQMRILDIQEPPAA
jgi:single-stranded-DNA-specific exonuclease